MTEDEHDGAYTEGQRVAYRTVLGDVLHKLGYNLTNPGFRLAALVREREETISALRSVCQAFGDNDWPDDLHLGDVIDKHLRRHLEEWRQGDVG